MEKIECVGIVLHLEVGKPPWLEQSIDKNIIFSNKKERVKDLGLNGNWEGVDLWERGGWGGAEGSGVRENCGPDVLYERKTYFQSKKELGEVR